MTLPPGFVYLKDIDPTIIQEVKYATEDNFIGRPIKGYKAGVCILTKEAASALSQVQQELLAKSLSLKIWDAYRPQTAVNDFIAWSQTADDQKMKKTHYPNVDKADFFKLGYLAEKSAHSRGSTVDLTLVRMPVSSGTPLEMAMGTTFDFMDERSHTISPYIQEEERNNRLFLKEVMEKAGFKAYDFEWWHFTLENEPFPDTYFDFPVE